MTDPPRAAAFIVTLYGDVVEPRGGVLWMGNVIQICAMVGLNESVVRTAVSRLVAAGQLVGERDGRRSFYRLTQSAQREYAQAAQVIYGGAMSTTQWTIAVAPGHDLARQGLATLGGDAWFGPDRGQAVPGVVFRADVAQAEGLVELVADRWDLAALDRDYCGFLDQWEAHGSVGTPDGALADRLRLVHAFRLMALRDPGLPAQALPAEWPEPLARACFARTYLSLSAQADAWVGARCLAATGPLPETTIATERRLARLRAQHTPV